MSSRCGVVLVTLLLVISVLVAKFGDFVTVENELVFKEPDYELPTLADDDDDILPFVQITDLHISHFADATRYDQLKQFCDVTINVIKPRLILATGDLTDAISRNHMTSGQNEAEWKLYWGIVKMCELSSSAQWLDVRGNHDNFNVAGFNSSENYYRVFGAQRARKQGSYMVTVQSSENTKYAFVAVDAVLRFGPKRVLNFVGQLDEEGVSKLERFQRTIEEKHINASIWFGHYPSSSMISVSPGFRSLAAGAVTYLCGHYHNLYGAVPHMYTRHHTGLLELELADWKLSRIYRLGILDHGLFSFVDVPYGAWPVVVVTNPKPAFSVQPSKEPFHSVLTSTHIRILIFSPTTIKQCQVQINDEPWRECRLSGKTQPLYTSPWQPDNYAHGLHVIRVRVRDNSGWKDHFEQKFSLDGSQTHFSLLARILLMFDFTTASQVLFGLSMILCIVPVCIIRLMHQAILRRKFEMHRFRNRFVRSSLRKLWIFSNTDCLFYPVSCYSIYLVFGPWFAGEIIDGRIGLVFSWGIFLGQDFLPGMMTYAYGFYHLISFNIPLIIILSYAADLRYQTVFQKQRTVCSSRMRLLQKAPYIFFLLCHLLLCVHFGMTYGVVALVVCPMRTWAAFMAIYLYGKAERLTEHQLLTVTKVWAH